MSEKSEERLALEKRAEELKISFPPNIGDKKLAEKVAEAEAKAEKNNNPDNDASKAGGGNAPAPAEQAKKAKAKKSKGKTTSAFLEVIGPKRGFWRAGIKFNAEGKKFAPGDLSEEQIEALEAEPKLTVIRGATPSE